MSAGATEHLGTETFRQAKAEDGGADLTCSIGRKVGDDSGIASVG